MPKYKPFRPIELKERTWPDKVLTKAPIWCSVDLRDGNQALINPMGSVKKHRLFNALVKMGYKEIEVGFPSASQTEFNFVRELIEKNCIPDDVTVQVLVQAREDLIQCTYKALRGVKNAIVHVYNSTSTLQRRVVFNKDKKSVKDIALTGARLIKEYAEPLAQEGANIRFQYSPESFTQTELPYALDVCEGVLDTLKASDKNPVIINLPATVEVSTPNIYADQVEWMSKNFSDRRRVIVSIHTHNDRGTGVAATELGLLAGAQRVEGTLFGNGERTGNVCLVTLGLNMLTQGIAPNIDFSSLEEIIEIAKYCTQLPIHERHPYAGELVYTAFSGSHQDAINKGLKALKKQEGDMWNVPYLPIDPEDIGRSYEAIIRINSQSGKGGISYILETDYGIKMPRVMQKDFSQYVQKLSDATGEEQNPQSLYKTFCHMYLNVQSPYAYVSHQTRFDKNMPNVAILSAMLQKDGEYISISGEGSGPMEAFIHALKTETDIELSIVDYTQHAIGQGDNAMAIAYVHVQQRDKTKLFGAGRDANITIASLKAIVCAFNRAIRFS